MSTRSKSGIPEIRALPRPLPTVAEMADAITENKSPILYGGTEAQAAAMVQRVHLAHRLREALRRGAESADLQDTDELVQRAEQFVEGCERSAAVPLWSDFCALGLGLSRQYLNSWMRSHPHHTSTQYLLKVKEGFASSLAAAALNGAVSPVPAIFTLKAIAGWKDSGPDEANVVDEAEEDYRTPEQIRQWLMDAYGIDEAEEATEAAEGASGALDDASDV